MSKSNHTLEELQEIVKDVQSISVSWDTLNKYRKLYDIPNNTNVREYFNINLEKLVKQQNDKNITPKAILLSEVENLGVF